MHQSHLHQHMLNTCLHTSSSGWAFGMKRSSRTSIRSHRHSAMHAMRILKVTGTKKCTAWTTPYMHTSRKETTSPQEDNSTVWRISAAYTQPTSKLLTLLRPCRPG